jgi:hypothetical protein
MKRVLLLDMPLHAPEFPSIALSLLKPGLERAGFPSDVLYPNLPFVERICRAQENVGEGVATFFAYREMTAYFVLLPDWLFAADLFGEPAEAGCHVGEILASSLNQWFRTLARPEVDLQAWSSRVAQMRAQVRPFLDDCLARVDWDAYDIVGFTCVYSQRVASLALARRIKERYPDKTILFGGPDCEQEMGEAHCSQVKHLTYLSS